MVESVVVAVKHVNQCAMLLFSELMLSLDCVEMSKLSAANTSRSPHFPRICSDWSFVSRDPNLHFNC